MNNAWMIRLAGVVALAGTLAGCGSSKVALRDKAEDAAAKTYAVVPGKSAIYVFRSETAHRSSVNVRLDQTILAATGPCTYFVWTVDPGPHIISSQTENVVLLPLTTSANTIYYVRQDLQGGLFQPRVKLSVVDEASARKDIDTCGLVASGMPSPAAKN